MVRLLMAFYVAAACMPSWSKQMTEQQMACVIARSQSGQPLFKAVGASGYAINQCTGERIVSSKELARLNRQRKDAWRALGYTCTVDCSGHEAGRQWAEDNDIDDESLCDGNSQSFIEGCEAYVRHYR